MLQDKVSRVSFPSSFSSHPVRRQVPKPKARKKSQVRLEQEEKSIRQIKSEMMRERAQKARPPRVSRQSARHLVSIESEEAMEGTSMISSPRSVEACLRCGLSPQQLLSRSMESFAEVGLSKLRQRMRYEHEKEQRDDRVRRVLRMRKRIVRVDLAESHDARVSGADTADAGEESEAAGQGRAQSCDSLSSRRDGASTESSSIKFIDVESRSSSSPYVNKFRSTLSRSKVSADFSVDVSLEVTRRRTRTAKELRAAMAAEKTRAQLEEHIRSKIRAKEETLRKKQQEQRMYRFEVIQQRDARLNARRAAILEEQRKWRERLAEEEAERKRMSSKKLQEEKEMKLAQNRIKQEMEKAKAREQERKRLLKEEARMKQQQRRREELEQKSRAREEVRRRQLQVEREKRQEEERVKQLRMQTAQETRCEEEERRKRALEEKKLEEERKLERLEEEKRAALLKRKEEKKVREVWHEEVRRSRQEEYNEWLHVVQKSLEEERSTRRFDEVREEGGRWCMTLLLRRR